jgi:hypothetical protein
MRVQEKAKKTLSNKKRGKYNNLRLNFLREIRVVHILEVVSYPTTAKQ